jgi:hypothetical protein
MLITLYMYYLHFYIAILTCFINKSDVSLYKVILS